MVSCWRSGPLVNSAQVSPLLQETGAIAWVGLCGDIFTFAGGVILAIDAAQQERRFKKVRERVKMYLHSPELMRLKISVSGIVVSSKEDIELPFIRHSALLAKIGTILLVVGFGFLLAARSLMIAGSSQEHENKVDRSLDNDLRIRNTENLNFS